MRLTNRVVEQVISEIAGVDVIPLIKFLKNKENISEFKIAERIKREVNETRNMLYRLYEANLVSFIRKKDKKKGWYIYYWTFMPERVKYLWFDLKKKKLESLKSRLTREENNYFFICNNNCIRLDFEQATEFKFKCPECGSLVNQEDNTKKIEEIKEGIRKLEGELKKG